MLQTMTQIKILFRYWSDLLCFISLWMG